MAKKVPKTFFSKKRTLKYGRVLMGSWKLNWDTKILSWNRSWYCTVGSQNSYLYADYSQGHLLVTKKLICFLNLALGVLSDFSQ